jgi:hypothetical protein
MPLRLERRKSTQDDGESEVDVRPGRVDPELHA